MAGLVVSIKPEIPQENVNSPSEELKDLGLSDHALSGRPVGSESNNVDENEESRLEKIRKLQQMSLLNRGSLPLLLRRF